MADVQRTIPIQLINRLLLKFTGSIAMNRDMFKQKRFTTGHVAHTALSCIPVSTTPLHKAATNSKRMPDNHLHTHVNNVKA